MEVEKMDDKFKILQEVYDVIEDRKRNPKEGSYTNYLLEKGLDKILKKVGEEASEVIIGAKNEKKDEIQYEIADLIYHLMVLMVQQGLSWDDITTELQKRR
jgi:phosphoribosyl-ATP pyrophosphohydrolase/phosphoribosyl-AMP cyclohydrolase